MLQQPHTLRDQRHGRGAGRGAELHAQQLRAQVVRVEEDVGERGAAEPVAHRVWAEEAAAEQLPGRDVRLLVTGRQQRGHHRALALGVLVQITETRSVVSATSYHYRINHTFENSRELHI